MVTKKEIKCPECNKPLYWFDENTNGFNTTEVNKDSDCCCRN